MFTSSTTISRKSKICSVAAPAFESSVDVAIIQFGQREGSWGTRLRADDAHARLTFSWWQGCDSVYQDKVTATVPSATGRRRQRHGGSERHTVPHRVVTQ